VYDECACYRRVHRELQMCEGGLVAWCAGAGSGGRWGGGVAVLRSGAVIDPGPPRLNFLCRSTREELEREYKPLRTTHVTGYGRCEQLFTLFFAYQ
jgi:hypothetical protein